MEHSNIADISALIYFALTLIANSARGVTKLLEALRELRNELRRWRKPPTDKNKTEEQDPPVPD